VLLAVRPPVAVLSGLSYLPKKIIHFHTAVAQRSFQGVAIHFGVIAARVARSICEHRNSAHRT